MPKYVYSSTLDGLPWNNSTRVDGDLGEVVRSLKREHPRDVLVHGSAQLAQSLLVQDLLDELRLMVFPVVLGSGKRLFGPSNDKKVLQLVDSRFAGDGVGILIYRPATATG